MNELSKNNSSNKLKSFTFIRRTVVLLILFVVIVIAIFYIVKRFPQETVEVETPTLEPTSDTVPLPLVSLTENSPLSSPISPLSVVSTPKLPDQTALDSLFETGLQLYQAGDYEKAKDKFNEMLAIDSNNVRAYDARGTIYTSLGNFPQAITDYTKAIELDPLYPPPYYNRGRIYSQQKQYDKALSDLNKAIELAPLFFGYRANGNVGLIYYQQGKYDEALKAFAAALDYDNSKADTYYFRGETYTAMGNYSAAIADYEAALSRFPQYDLAQQSLGYAYYKTKQFDQALTALDKTSELTPNHPVTNFYRMLVYLATNRPDKAKTEANQAVKSLDNLPEDKRELIVSKVLTELNTLAKENPQLANIVEEIIKLISQ